MLLHARTRSLLGVPAQDLVGVSHVSCSTRLLQRRALHKTLIVRGTTFDYGQTLGVANL